MLNLQKNLHKYLLFAVLAVLALGTTFYHFVEKLDWIDAYYFSVTTLATVGFGDITPQTKIGKIFTTFYIFAGVGIITTFISATMERWKKRIKKHKNQNK